MSLRWDQVTATYTNQLLKANQKNRHLENKRQVHSTMCRLVKFTVCTMVKVVFITHQVKLSYTKHQITHKCSSPLLQSTSCISSEAYKHPTVSKPSFFMHSLLVRYTCKEKQTRPHRVRGNISSPRALPWLYINLHPKRFSRVIA